MGEGKRRSLLGLLLRREKTKGGLAELIEQDPVGHMFMGIAERLKEHLSQGHTIDLIDHVDSEDGSIMVEMGCSVCVNELPIACFSEGVAEEFQRILTAAGIHFEDRLEN